MSNQNGVESKVREIRRKTRKRYSAEEKIRIVLEGLRGEESIAALCRKEGIASNLYYKWSKEFLEVGKRRLMGDTKRQATSGEVLTLRKENGQLKELSIIHIARFNREFLKAALFSRPGGLESGK